MSRHKTKDTRLGQGQGQTTVRGRALVNGAFDNSHFSPLYLHSTFGDAAMVNMDNAVMHRGTQPCTQPS